MNQVTVLFYASGTQTFLFSSQDRAETAYLSCCSALKDWRQFKNDKTDTVEIVDDNRGATTIRVEHIASISWSGDDQKTEALQLEWAAFNGRMQAAAEKSANSSPPST